MFGELKIIPSAEVSFRTQLPGEEVYQIMLANTRIESDIDSETESGHEEMHKPFSGTILPDSFDVSSGSRRFHPTHPHITGQIESVEQGCMIRVRMSPVPLIRSAMRVAFMVCVLFLLILYLDVIAIGDTGAPFTTPVYVYISLYGLVYLPFQYETGRVKATLQEILRAEEFREPPSLYKFPSAVKPKPSNRRNTAKPQNTRESAYSKNHARKYDKGN